jgi:hypothetical protein
MLCQYRNGHQVVRKKISTPGDRTIRYANIISANDRP